MPRPGRPALASPGRNGLGGLHGPASLSPANGPDQGDPRPGGPVRPEGLVLTSFVPADGLPFRCRHGSASCSIAHQLITVSLV